MNRLCKVISISKQVVYKQEKKQAILDIKISELVYQAGLIRSDHPGCGVKKYITRLNRIL